VLLLAVTGVQYQYQFWDLVVVVLLPSERKGLIGVYYDFLPTNDTYFCLVHKVNLTQPESSSMFRVHESCWLWGLLFSCCVAAIGIAVMVAIAWAGGNKQQATSTSKGDAEVVLVVLAYYLLFSGSNSIGLSSLLGRGRVAPTKVHQWLSWW
jgi:hypothetical protein